MAVAPLSQEFSNGMPTLDGRDVEGMANIFESFSPGCGLFAGLARRLLLYRGSVSISFGAYTNDAVRTAVVIMTPGSDEKKNCVGTFDINISGDPKVKTRVRWSGNVEVDSYEENMLFELLESSGRTTNLIRLDPIAPQLHEGSMRSAGVIQPNEGESMSFILENQPAGEI